MQYTGCTHGQIGDEHCGFSNPKKSTTQHSTTKTYLLNDKIKIYFHF